MKKIFISLILIFYTYANAKVHKAVAIAIFDKNGYGENIQHVLETKADYNGVCYSKVAVFGYLEQSAIKVQIGNSIGHFVKSIPIYGNHTKTLIGHEMTFKHYTVKKGYFEVKIDDKIYDTKVFVK